MKKPVLIIAGLLTIAALEVFAKDKLDLHGNHQAMNHGQHQPQSNAIPKEVGDAGFAAIAEIVSILSTDPKTDWSKVNINGLRDHLVLMNSLVTGAQVKEIANSNGFRFEVTGSDNSILTAIRQMVPAHTTELDKMEEFTATTESIDGGVALIITGNTEASTAKIKGLGFFGLIATGSHHQMHHLAMALGQGHHGMNH